MPENLTDGMSERGLASSLIRRIFPYTGPRSVRRLCLFLLLVLSILYGGDLVARQFTHGTDPATLFFVRETRIFLTFLFATWIMGRSEGRSIAEYGLP